jgi:hypothetical protein
MLKNEQPISLTEIARIETSGVNSLVWAGDELIDWASGGRRFRLDGTMVDRAVSYAYRFDAAFQSPSGEFAVLYERLGTKGLVLQRGKIIREINRSFYHAEVYEYPVTIGVLRDGRQVLAHCPEEYNRIELDDVATGERLSQRDDRAPADFFHSRLALNASGTLLLSAGWCWQPIDLVAVFRLNDALRDSRVLDSADAVLPLGSEVSSAAFIDDQRLVVATSEETFLDDEDFQDPKNLAPHSIAIWDVASNAIVSRASVSTPVGTIMPVNERHIVGLYEFPKVIDLATGTVVASLPELSTGKQTSSIIHHLEALPPLAIDPAGKRLAVANRNVIHVIEVRDVR